MPTPFDQDAIPPEPPTAPTWPAAAPLSPPSSTPPPPPPPPPPPTQPGPPGASTLRDGLPPTVPIGPPGGPPAPPVGPGGSTWWAPGPPPAPLPAVDAPASEGRLSKVAVAAVVALALLIGSVAGGSASWFAFARSDGGSTPARSESAFEIPDPSTSGGSSEPLSGWDEVSAAVNPGVVDIETQTASGVGAGTGMILTSDGQVLTNNHVVEGARSIVVTLATTGASYRAEIVGADPGEDVAVIRLIGAEDLPTIPLGDSDEVAVGDLVAAIGNAGGVGGTPSIAAGRVTALGQQITATAEDGSDAQTLRDMIQVAANVVPGDSGGPLADDSGKVVGMTTAASVGGGTGRARAFGGSSAGIGYAIPIDRALEVAKQLVADGGSSSSSDTSGGGYLGVQVTTSTTGGVSIAAVMSGSPAAAAGIQVGDVVVAVDDARVDAADELVDLLAGHEAGDEVQVTWFAADGRAHQAIVTLAAR